MLHIFTHGNKIERFAELRESADLCGLQINYITPPRWEGYFDKISYLHEEIKELPDDDIICFVDGFDVIATAGEEEILEKFHRLNCDLVLSAEANCYPDFLRDAHPDLNTKSIYKYVNSGGYIGYKRAVWKLLNWKSFTEIKEYCRLGTDQYYFQEYFIQNYKQGGIALDYGQTIFQVMYGIPWLDFTIHKGRVYNKLLKERPCFLHFNGESLLRLDETSILPVFVNVIKQSHMEDNVLDMKGYQPKWSQYGFWRGQLKPPPKT
jgi:hypothetical protein